MAVDEFGREIPAGRSRRDRSPSPGGGYGSPSRNNIGGNDPSVLHEALPTSRYGGGGRDNHDRGRKRKHRSESPGPRGHRGSGKSSSKQQPHPSVLYAEEPMLCQYLWKEANPDKEEDEYTEYRRSYCLNYVRTFFNEHMDDSWFRSLYSPLGKYNVSLQERARANNEAKKFHTELEASLSKNNNDSHCFFVLKARLGGGVKQSRKLPGDDYHHHSSPAKARSSLAPTNPVPSTHVLAMTSQVLAIQDIPPYVTNEQLKTALMNHVAEGTKPSALTIYSSSPGSDLTRSAYPETSDEIRKEIIQQLNHVDRGSTAPSDGAHVPRKEDTYIPKILELQVECSDAYGRLEFDADGKGGAPEEAEQVRDRKASVRVSTVPLTPNVQVLSAALSSRDRIPDDFESARKLAKAYDERRNITGNTLEIILSKTGLVLENSTDPQDLEDALDLSIAYLRRVHLFSFYNGCTPAPKVADVYNGNHPTSTIHMRLANADDILQQTKEQEAKPPTTTDEGAEAAPVKVDLLVQRLNDKIRKALDECNSWGDSTNVLVSEVIDKQAKQIEQGESQVEGVWIEDHALVDEDGRARCSFHFCRKLFKDKTFLRKHLIKKHSEFLKAEMAKCHDSFMMKAWDAQEQRPVPPILVDCGRAFSVVPSPVIGAAEPMAADPEPELWRRQEERRKQEEEEAEARRERYHPPTDIDGPLSEERGPHRERPPPQNYVDVDDMKEEKVEMAFDKVEIPVQPPKKKKKKKKLL